MRTRSKLAQRLQRYKTNDKIIVFGTGKMSEVITEQIKLLNFKIEYYVDNDTSKWSLTFMNKPIFSPEKIKQEKKSNVIIVVASMYYQDIFQQLNKMGFKENVFYHNMFDEIDIGYYENAENRRYLNTIKDIHKGKRCFILGSGPSLNECNIDFIKNEISFGVNGIFLHPSFIPTYYVTVSNFFWKQYIEEIRNVKSKMRFLPSDIPQLKSNAPTIWLNYCRPKYSNKKVEQLPVPADFSTNCNEIIYGGGTVIFVCLQLAYYMGFDTAILLGVDHDYGQNRNKESYGGYVIPAEKLGYDKHFINNYYGNNVNVHLDLLAMERGYKLAKKAFESDGRKILNATPNSKLDIYHKVEYSSLFYGK